MLRYLLRRLLSGLITLWGITVITFVVIKLAPGDPAQIQTASIQDRRVSADMYERLREYYQLDQPLLKQYVSWLGRLATGNLGRSFYDGLPVSTKIGHAFWPTVTVAALSLLLAFLISIPIGIYSAVRQDGPFDKIVSTLLYMLYSVP